MSDQPTTYIRTLGRYHLLDELGRGAMAVVYRGFDPVIGRTVALKTIAFDTSSEAGELRQRLYREACAAGTLAHPNIVTVYDVIEEGGTTAVAMEFIEGQTLAALITERAPLPLDQALDIFEQIVAALDFAGSKGIVHRDIKPANIMVSPDGRVKVADFGVARIAVSTMTQTGTVVGSPSYMSPEQVRGQPLDGRSDLFSAAVVLYELLTKERPFAGDDVATTMYRIVHEPPTPPSRFNAAVGPALVAVFERALAKDAGDRYRSGAEVCRELRQALNVANLPDVLTAAAEPAKHASRAKLYALAAIPVVLLLGLVAFGSRGSKPPDSSGDTAAVSDAQPPATPPMADLQPAPAVEAAAQPAVPAPTGAVSTIPTAAGPAPTVPPARPQVTPPASGAASTGKAGGASAGKAKAGPVPPAVQAPSSTASPAAPPARAAAGALAPVEEPVAPIQRVMPPPTQAPSAPAVERARPDTASLQLAFEGGAFPVTLYADGKQIGRVDSAGTRVSVEAGRVALRAVNESVFLDHDFGVLTLRANEQRVLTVPGTASAYVGVRGDNYAGLRITLDGRVLPGPYPAQLPRIAASPHSITFKWSEGVLQGVEVSDTIDLTGGHQFSIRAVPENGQVVAQKLR